jgi:hypothetical protein
MAKNLHKLSAEERSGIEQRAAQMLENLDAL